DRQRILGAWEVVRVSANGKHLAHEVRSPQVWMVTRSLVTIRYQDGTEDTFAYDLDSARNPRAIDLLPVGPLARWAFQGVYELEGDRLKVCRSRGSRPARLHEGAVQRGQILFFLKRLPK